jgi:hypothetical protein
MLAKKGLLFHVCEGMVRGMCVLCTLYSSYSQQYCGS